MAIYHLLHSSLAGDSVKDLYEHTEIKLIVQIHEKVSLNVSIQYCMKKPAVLYTENIPGSDATRWQ